MGQLAGPVLVAAVAFALAVPLLVWAVTTRSVVERQVLLANLQRDLDRRGPGDEVDMTLAPSATGTIVSRILPRPLVRNLDRLHARAGRPAGWPMERILVSKVILAVVAALVSVVLWNNSGTTIYRAVAVLAFLFIAFLPEMLLSSYAARRRESVALKLPDMMDQLSIAVEAGLGFEGALNHVARNTSGPLADEIVRTLQDIQVGVPRRAAYQALSDRVDLPDLRRFLRAIIQAEQHGISIARVLNIQASEMRIKRRLRAEEKAMRIPVMVAFPLFLFIFPALLVVVLGPAMINIIDVFSGGLLVPTAP